MSPEVDIPSSPSIQGLKESKPPHPLLSGVILGGNAKSVRSPKQDITPLKSKASLSSEVFLYSLALFLRGPWWE